MPFWPSKGKSGKGKAATGSRSEHMSLHSARLLLPVLQYHSNALGSEQVCPRSDGLCQDCLPSPRICSACLPLGQALPRANDFLFRGLVTRLSCPGVIGVHQAGPTVSRHFHFDLEEAVDTNASEEKGRAGNPHVIPTGSKTSMPGALAHSDRHSHRLWRLL